MKLTGIFLACLAGGLGNASAQQFNLYAPAPTPEFTRPNLQFYLYQPGVKMEGYQGGVFTRTSSGGRQLRIVNPLHLNPVAPRSLGNGADSLVYNPSTGRAEGVALFSFRF